MSRTKDDQTLPLNTETDMEPSSSITYATEVIAIIAGLAASEVEGIAGMVNVSSGIKGKNKNITRGIKVEVGSEEVSVDLYVNVEYGTPIQRASHDVQESVRKSIESMTGLHVVRVDVHVMGVSFEKENNALQAGAGKAVLESGSETRSDIKKDIPAEQKPDTDAAADNPVDPPAEETETPADEESVPREENGSENPDGEIPEEG